MKLNRQQRRAIASNKDFSGSGLHTRKSKSLARSMLQNPSVFVRQRNLRKAISNVKTKISVTRNRAQLPVSCSKSEIKYN